ncbi:hypothetical protein Esti_002104 [Eimeria stiedai]
MAFAHARAVSAGSQARWSKRELFPRFYFLSNGKLLELVSQGRQVAVVESIIRKCFANIHTLWLEGEKKSPDIAGMVSAEGERVAFHKKFKLRGPVEKWLSDVESSMMKTLQKIIRQKKNEVYGRPKKEWVFQTPAQVAACVAQLFWTLEVEEALEGEPQQLKMVHEQQLQELQLLITLVRLPLSLLERANISALAIQTLHNRDVVESLIRGDVTGPDVFDWQKQLRHYWQEDNETLAVQQLSAVFQYGHEYLGAPQRLVITPLTDRCWLTITTALKQLCVNSSIAGPAGSGKTESVKELAKLLGLFCVVLNCSDAVDLYVLDKLFAGVMASGAWACLDEFNRLDVEVLSVVAQQLLDMRHSLLKAYTGSAAQIEAGANRTKDKDTFLSLAAPSPASSSCGVFVTLNPNYAGRAELPDNLQLLFRPVAMVTPDFSAIAEIIIFSEGFADSKRLSKKFVEFFKLCPDQLSPQVHYDFGLRAAKTALLLGGQLRRLNPLKSEEAALAQAIRDSNEPKLLADDKPIFRNLLADFFPDVSTDGDQDVALSAAITDAMKALDLTAREDSVKAALHLHQLLDSRRGVIVLGGAMAGKSSTITTLSAALTALKNMSLPSSKAGSAGEEAMKGHEGEAAGEGRDPRATNPEEEDEEAGDDDPSPRDSTFAAPQEAVHCRFLNPKALDTFELLGEFNPMTKDWKDGVASAIIREFVANENGAANQWLVFDGPIDSIWVECLNTVLDDNQMLCLPNGERIQLTPAIRLLFEVSDLSAASPATVSRCGMLFVTEHVLHWRDVMASWFDRLSDRVCEEFCSIIRGLFELSIPPCEALLLTEGFNQEAVSSSSSSSSVYIVSSICRMLAALLELPVSACAAMQRQSDSKEQSDSKSRRLSERASSVNAESVSCPYTGEQLEFLAAPAFFFCFVWTVGGGADAPSQKVFSRFCEELFDDYVSLPKGGDVIDVCFNFELAAPQRLARKRCSSCVTTAEQHEVLAATTPADKERGASFSLTNQEAMDKARRLKAYFTLWEKTIPEFKYNPGLPFHSLMVPTKETLRATTLMSILAGGKIPILLTGPAGSGKTSIVCELLRRRQEEGGMQIVSQTFSSLIKPAALQTLLESRLETKRKTLLGPPGTQDCMVWIDDVNLPLPDAYGSQPTAELLRQMEEFKGFYDRKRIYWKGIERLQFVLSAGPCSAGRQALPARVSRHFHLLCVSEPDELSAQRMFQCLLDAHFSHLDVKQEIRSQAKALVDASVELYRLIKGTLLPTPSRPAYLFNFRHLKSIFQGLIAADAAAIAPRNALARQVSRTFGDRLMGSEEAAWLEGQMGEIAGRKLGYSVGGVGSQGGPYSSRVEAPLWGDWFVTGKDKAYREATSKQQLLKLLHAFNEEAASRVQLQGAGGGDPTIPSPPFVLFPDVIRHVAALCRTLRYPKGHALLLGFGATGKQTVARLAACIRDFELVEYKGQAAAAEAAAPPRRSPQQQPQAGSSGDTSKNSNNSISSGSSSSMTLDKFREDLKTLMLEAGLSDGKETLFLVNESRIADDAILADLDAIANTGEVPNLLESDSVDTIVADLSPVAASLGLFSSSSSGSSEIILSLFRENLLNRLHVCLCLSPVGSGLRRRIRLYPGLTKAFDIQYFGVWGPTALTEVASHLFATSSLQLPMQQRPLQQEQQQQQQQQQLKDTLSELCVAIHRNVEEEAKKFLQQQNRIVYVTPKAFLDLISLFSILSKERRGRVQEKLSLLSSGIQKLEAATAQVHKLQVELQQLEPVLHEKHVAAETLLQEVEADKAVAEAERRKVGQEEEALGQRKREALALQAEAQHELDKAMPAIETALSSLDALDKRDITEIKSFTKPPPLVMLAMEAVCVVLGEKTDWEHCRKVLSDTGFLNRLIKCDKEHIPASALKRLEKILQRPDFTPEVVGKQSVAAMSLCMWVTAINKFAQVSKEVEPKRRKLAAADEALQEAQARCREVEVKVQEMETELQQQMKEKEKLEEETQLCQIRLQRASFLTKGLAEEAIRWRQSLSTAAQQLASLEGDALLAAGSIIYLGPFTAAYRNRLLQQWQQQLQQQQLAYTPDFDLCSIMSNPIELNEWRMQGLPGDSSSAFGGVVVSASLSIGKVPLAIDPQQQAKKWIEEKEKEGGLKVVSLQTHKLQNILVSCVKLGQPLLVEDIGEEVPAMFSPLLQLPLQSNGLGAAAPVKVKVGDSEIDKDPHFKLIFITKLENPHYLPEVCLVNFSVTREGLEAQLLGKVVRLENPEAETQKTNMQIRNTTDQRQLQELEETMLQLLSNSSGSILDDAKLTETLKQARSTADGVKARLQQTAAVMAEVDLARAAYQPVAFRAAYLFFVVQELKKLDCMYTSSLTVFLEAFVSAVRDTQQEQQPAPMQPPHSGSLEVSPAAAAGAAAAGAAPAAAEGGGGGLEQRIRSLVEAVTLSVFSRTLTGLFEKHKLPFALAVAAEVLRREKYPEAAEACTLLLRGGAVEDAGGSVIDSTQGVANPVPDLLQQRQWEQLQCLSNALPSLQRLPTEIIANGDRWRRWIRNPHIHKLPPPLWEEEDLLQHAFEMLLLLKIVREDAVAPLAREIVHMLLGPAFLEFVPPSLESVLSLCSSSRPLLVILSPGSDPTSSFFALAEQQQQQAAAKLDFQCISLGRSQGPKASRVLNNAIRQGGWVLLQNCHLARSWMPELHKVVECLGTSSEAACKATAGGEGSSSKEVYVHPNFRLFLTSQPADFFPVSVLQGCLKYALEQPRGISACLQQGVTQVVASSNAAAAEACGQTLRCWRALKLSLLLFHAVAQERGSFGSIGWNIPYRFGSADLWASLSLMGCLYTSARGGGRRALPPAGAAAATGPLRRLLCEVTYGGRLTDAFDEACLRALAETFVDERIFYDQEAFAPKGFGVVPFGENDEAVCSYASHQLKTTTEMFGLHPSASLMLQKAEATELLQHLQTMQPRDAAGAWGSTTEQVVLQRAELLLQRLSSCLSGPLAPNVPDLAAAIAAAKDGEPAAAEKRQLETETLAANSLGVFFCQELSRFSLLLQRACRSLEQLRLAIKGCDAFSVETECVFAALSTNQVPAVWAAVSYPSLRPLASWIENLQQRVGFVSLCAAATAAAEGGGSPEAGRGASLGAPPTTYWLSAFYYPKGFLTAVLQRAARQRGVSADRLRFEFGFLDVADPSNALPDRGGGVYVHGLSIEGGAWSSEEGAIVEAPQETTAQPFPVTLFLPTVFLEDTTGEEDPSHTSYACPLYATAARGASGGLVACVALPILETPATWVLRGTALLCEARE